MVTAEHLPWCPAEAAVTRAKRRRRRWIAILLAMLASAILLVVLGKLDHWHGRWVVPVGSAMALGGLLSLAAETWVQDRGRGPWLPKWLLFAAAAGFLYGFALLITQSHWTAGGGGGG
jgi:hypothetical protein